MRSVAIVGTGLIGASIGLALQANGVDVRLADRDHDAVEAAVRRGAGRPMCDDDPPADLAVIAVPPGQVPAMLRETQLRHIARHHTDVASVKTEPVRSARALGCDMTTFVPGHPMGGSERSGPGAATPDLFHGVTWVLCPQHETRQTAVDAVRDLAVLCGARPVVMDTETHDKATALVSHVPHVVASAMAAALVGADPDALRLAGRGVRDVTRIAAGNHTMWTEILAQNARWTAAALSDVAAVLVEVSAALQLAGTGDTSFLGVLTRLLRQGISGRRALDTLPEPDHNEPSTRSITWSS